METFPLTSEHFPRKAQTDRAKSAGLAYACFACQNESGRKTGKVWRVKQRETVLRHYGGETTACACCGERHIQFLAIDHIGGGGREHFNATSGKVYADIVRRGFPEGFRVLCHNCNGCIGKFGYCAHRPDDNNFCHTVAKKKRQPDPIDPELDMVTTEVQACIICGQAMPLNSNYFYKDVRMRRRFTKRCRVCFRNYMRPLSKDRRDTIRAEVLTAYGGSEPKCECCGECHEQFLEIDHIGGGGKRDRSHNGNTYLRLKREGYPPGFRVLCSSCNMSQGFYGFCPHNAKQKP